MGPNSSADSVGVTQLGKRVSNIDNSAGAAEKNASDFVTKVVTDVEFDGQDAAGEVRMFNRFYGQGSAWIDAPNVIKMKRIPGMPLSQFVQCRSFDRSALERSFMVMIQSIENIGIDHRDLHGMNVIVAPSGECFPVDFGQSSLIKGRACGNFNQAHVVLREIQRAYSTGSS